jgi:hypothetical protein
MKKYTYLISLISSIVLTYALVTMGKFILAAIAGALCIFYVWKIAKDYKDKPQSDIHSNAGTYVSASKGEALAELKELLKLYTRNMKIFRNAMVTGYLLAAVIMFLNIHLAIAMGLLLIPVVYKFYKNYQAVRLIETGIAKR